MHPAQHQLRSVSGRPWLDWAGDAELGLACLEEVGELRWVRMLVRAGTGQEKRGGQTVESADI